MSTVVDPGVSSTIITCIVAGLGLVVLNMIDRMIERREFNARAKSQKT